MKTLLKRIVRSQAFQRFIIVIILLDGCLLVIQTASVAGQFYNVISPYLLALTIGTLTLDVLLRIVTEDKSPWYFFKKSWNVLDFCILVALFLLPAHRYIAAVRLPRLLRLSRACQLLGMFKSFGLSRNLSQRLQLENKLRAEHELLQTVFQNIPIMIALYDKGDRIQYSNHAFQNILGWTKLNCPRGAVLEQLYPDIDDQQAVSRWKHQCSGDWLELKTFNRNNGSYLTTRWTCVKLADGSIIDIGQDITCLRKSERNLFEQRELAKATLESIDDAVLTINPAGIVTMLNPAAEALISIPAYQAQNQSIFEVVSLLNMETRQPIQYTVDMILTDDEIFSSKKSFLLVSANQDEFIVNLSTSPIYNYEQTLLGMVLVFRDITQTQLLSQELQWRATHDSLTGLVNRQEFENRLSSLLEQVSKHPTEHYLCYFDLDGFKVVNDSSGHLAGDQLLRDVSDIIRGQIRSSDLLARLGGDEFGLILYECTTKGAQTIAEKIRHAIESYQFYWNSQVFTISVSIGLAIIDARSQKLTDVLGTADSACYVAKNQGRNQVYFYQPGNDELMIEQDKLRWFSRINQAIKDDRLCLYVQEIIPIESQRTKPRIYEILLRLIDENNNLVTPSAFLPVAERYGMMTRIDQWVVSKSLEYLAQAKIQQSSLQVVKTPEVLYSINLSGASINDRNFHEFLRQKLTTHQNLCHIICFEITETVAICNLKSASLLIQFLKDLGCCFALDDFGAGMSSFAYLKHLNVDYLKIDGSFVRNMATSPFDRTVVESCHRIAHVMGLKTIAEFVESEEIIAELKMLGMDYAQGYGVAMPKELTSV
ncbi:MAG: EAL domain-containing protein [Cyanothece sp. SIO2G6]|nr:EAL domain-containing protein [Cyanothece sp. SIO2G6]